MIGAVVLALVGTFAIVAYVNGAEDRALAGEDVVKVLVVNEQIPAGTPAKELGDRVSLEQVSAKVQADGAVTSSKQLGNEVASATMVPGEQVVRARFVTASAFRAKGASVSVPDGLLQTTVSLDPERAVGGNLSPGSTVAVTASFAPSVMEYSSHIILHKVLVTNVQLDEQANSTTEDTEDTEDTSAVEPGDAPRGRFLVTLALDAASAERVVFAAEHGTVWLSLEPRSANETGTKILQAGNIYQ